MLDAHRPLREPHDLGTTGPAWGTPEASTGRWVHHSTDLHPPGNYELTRALRVRDKRTPNDAPG